MDKHDTVGIDCVAMCVNDVISLRRQATGISLDYIAVGKNLPRRSPPSWRGVAEGCRQAGCALVGGETAEMPASTRNRNTTWPASPWASWRKMKIIDNSKMQAGDAVIALASSGVHSNGFSLVRKIFNVEYADIWHITTSFPARWAKRCSRPQKFTSSRCWR